MTWESKPRSQPWFIFSRAVFLRQRWSGTGIQLWLVGRTQFDLIALFLYDYHSETTIITTKRLLWSLMIISIMIIDHNHPHIQTTRIFEAQTARCRTDLCSTTFQGSTWGQGGWWVGIIMMTSLASSISYWSLLWVGIIMITPSISNWSSLWMVMITTSPASSISSRSTFWQNSSSVWWSMTVWRFIHHHNHHHHRHDLGQH